MCFIVLGVKLLSTFGNENFKKIWKDKFNTFELV